MYEIIKIRKKRNSNYNLYIKDYKEEKVEFHIDIIYEYKLHLLDEIDEEDFEKILKENEKILAKQYALRILSASNKTQKELILKLKQKNFSKDAIDYAQKCVQNYDIIDEQDIAEKLVDGKYKNKKYSKRKMQTELRKKGISSDIIYELTSNIQQDEEYENALYFAKRKYNSISSKDKQTIKRRLASALTYRGFSYSIIKKVIDELTSQY